MKVVFPFHSEQSFERMGLKSNRTLIIRNKENLRMVVTVCSVDGNNFDRPFQYQGEVE